VAPNAEPVAQTAPQSATPRSLALPSLVSSPTDVGRLVRELEAIEELFLQLQLRKGGDPLKLPRTSYLLDRLVELNQLNILNPDERQQLKAFLIAIKEQAPILHISFSADPSATFLDKLMVWLRQEIHPAVLVNVGLQPNIGAGCIVRTANHQLDFSLRQSFIKNRELLISQLITINRAAAAKPEAAV
jgi:hypothetical protein